MSRITLEQKLRIVRTAAEVFGKKAAAEVWERVGLPPLEAPQPPAELLRGGDPLVFAAQRLVAAPGKMVGARALYTSYAHWCDARGEAAVAERTFCQRMRRSGIRRLNARYRWYCDVELESSECNDRTQLCLVE